MLVLNIIGAGKLGKTIGRLMVKNQLAKIGGVYNTTLASASQAVNFIGQGQACCGLDEMPTANLILISTPDNHIKPLCLELCQRHLIKPNTVVFHCSGVLTSDVIAQVKQHQAYVASIHPMKSFADPEFAVETYHQTYCAMEGDIEALTVLEPLFKSLGSITYLIDKKAKALYHAAGVFASNYLVTLAEEASQCLLHAGITEPLALQLITSLMKGTLLNLEKTGSTHEALTGPIKRGDSQTIQAHLAAFPNSNIRHLYSSLGCATIAIAQHSTDTELNIKACFELED